MEDKILNKALHMLAPVPTHFLLLCPPDPVLYEVLSVSQSLLSCCWAGPCAFLFAENVLLDICWAFQQILGLDLRIAHSRKSSLPHFPGRSQVYTSFISLSIILCS